MLDAYFLRQQVHKDTPIPLYYQIKEILLGYIKNSDMGSVIPTETELCNLYGVSRPTIRQAMRELEMSGLIYRQKAKGSFVAEPKVEQEITTYFEDFEERMRRHGNTVRKEVIEFATIPADEVVARKLQLQLNDSVYKLRTVRYADDIPMVLTLSFLPAALFSTLTRADVEQNTVRQLIAREHTIKQCRKTFEVKLASDFETQLFGLKRVECLQYLETICFAGDGKPLEYTMERYRSDKSKFTITFHY
ncbi:MAG: GntR family transcriptional regulator [Candidatus Limiplasma sp.]|mgnify:CR=1 FL=1|nr:GntR family transcriptional regulator [Candidatus Limiplasma sp.]